MLLTMDMEPGTNIPRRGDFMQTNVGDKRERTWLILNVHRLRPTKGIPRCRVWAERWWQVDVDLRWKLYKTAERAGGQKCIVFKRYPSKKKGRYTFESLMRSHRD